MDTRRFVTEVQIPDCNWKTGHEHKNMFIGSCFTENVGNKMVALKYDTDVNPFGILYNPRSICDGLQILLEGKTFKKQDIIRHGGLWHSFYHHGRFSSPDEEKTLSGINNRIKHSSLFLKSAHFLLITLGTAWVYEYRKSGQTVANCHKIPAREFNRYRLSTENIVNDFSGVLPKIWTLNPDLKVIFTVSPIRHWNDGAMENQRSKATLILAVDRIVRELKNHSAYFPAYEIVMDELRDYRFYAEDMIHISEVATEYIWEKFEHFLIEEKSRLISREIQKTISAMNHKPFNRVTMEHFNFLKHSLAKVKELKDKNPYLNLKLEMDYFTREMDEIRNFIPHAE